MSKEARVLIVEDEESSLKNLEHAMKQSGYETTGTTSGDKALELLEERDFDVILTDLKIDNVDGVEVLEKSRKLQPDAEVIIFTGYPTIRSAVEITKKGACDYIAKPFDLDDILKAVHSALEKVKQRRENTQLLEQIERFGGKVKILTENPVVEGLLETSRHIAPTDCNVLITGESGIGKELFARYIHLMSHRAENQFIAINCSAFTEEMLLHELFGYEKGAFSEATSAKKGLMETTSGGTLYLDEITEMPAALQVRLLRVLQEKELLRQGGSEPVPINVRIVAATNSDIQKAVRENRFRSDLYYRLNVVSLNIPPLSERRDDIPLLCQYFLKKYSAVMDKNVSEISPSVLGLLINYDFPGNVRELENIIERGVALANGDTIEMAHLPQDFKELNIKTFRRQEGRLPSLEEQEISYIQWVLRETGGNKTAAAEILGIDRVSLWRKIKKHGLEDS